jgi:hypothetical protein
MVRVTKPNGLIHIDFGPLYNGPWGLHAYRTIRMPYPQFLFSEEFLNDCLEKVGIWDLGKPRDKLQYVNQWSVNDFQMLFENIGCEIRSFTVIHTDVGLPVILAYPESFRGRGLSLDEVISTNLIVTLVKPS